MLAHRVTGDKLPRTDRSELLTDSRRRVVLAMLAGRSGGVAPESLATQIAAIERDEKPEALDDETVEGVRIELRHRHLPELVAAGLLTWIDEPELVAATDHPAFETPLFQAVLERPNADWEDFVDAISDDLRRRILAIVEGTDRTFTRAELARRLAADEGDTEPPAEAPTELQVQLHHTHLPKLDDAGLIEYDPDAGTVVDIGEKTVAEPLSASA